MPTVDDLLLRIRTLGAPAATAEVKGVETGLKGMGSTAKTVAGVAGIAGVAFGLKDITSAAIKFQAQIAQTQNALRNTGQYSQQNVRHLVDAADTLATHGGYDPSTSLAGMQRLIAAHDSVRQAIKDETLVTDISRATHMSYMTALRAVMTVEQGRTTGLTRLGIVINPIKSAELALADAHVTSANKMKILTAEGEKFTAMQKLHYDLTHQVTEAQKLQAKATDVQATKTLAMTVLWGRFGGATEAFSHSAAGAASNFRNSVDILGQRLGTFLLPAISSVLHVLSSVVGYFVENRSAAIALGIAIGALTALWGATKLIQFVGWMGEALRLTKLWTVASYALSAAQTIFAAATGEAEAQMALLGAGMIALDAIPIIAAIAGIIAVVVLLATHFDDVKRIALAAFHWILGAAKDVWSWIKQNWPILAGVLLAPFTFGISLIIALFHKQLWGAVKSVLGWIEGAFTDTKNWIVDRFNDILHFVTGLPGKFADAGKGIWDFLKTGLIAIVNWCIDRVNNLIDAYNSTIGQLPGMPTIGDLSHIGASGQQLGPAGTPILLHLTQAQQRQAYGKADVAGHRGAVEVGSAAQRRAPVGGWQPRVVVHHYAGPQPGDQVVVENNTSWHVGSNEFARAVQYSLAKVKAVR